jgi:predicted HAD superfamily Cof-like phosphohydrolase
VPETNRPAYIATTDDGHVLHHAEGKRFPDRSPSFAVRALAEFHAHPNSLHEGTNTQALRRTLHDEENAELMVELDAAATGAGDLAKIAREIADVLYITYGTAWAFGIDADAAFAEVHRAAMDKMRVGLRRADGKIQKPPGFVPPDMTEAIQGARLEPEETDHAA